MAYNVIGQVKAIITPTVNDDSTKGFAIGSEWVDSVGQATYMCYGAAVGAAIWRSFGAGGGVQVVDPLQMIAFDANPVTFVAGTAWA